MDYPDELSQRMNRAAYERRRQIQEDLDNEYSRRSVWQCIARGCDGCSVCKSSEKEQNNG